VRLLVIGGTQFVGRAFVEQAVRRGHELTLFHRGATEPDDFPDVEHLHGDRDGGIEILRGKTWDAALDTCAYFPRAVREIAAVLTGAISHYTLVSSLSVHPDDLPAFSTEEAPTRRPPATDNEEITGETYGALKVACEQEALRAFPGGCSIIRPGYVVGPHDPTDRFTYYVRRAARAGEMLAPGPPDAPMQVVDVRDLGLFMLACIEKGDSEVYGVVGPADPLTTRSMLHTVVEVAGAGTDLRWVDEDFLKAEAGDDVYRWLPLWDPQYPGIHTYDARKAIDAGLRHRPLRETVNDTLRWDRERGLPRLKVGLSPEKERDLLAAWRSRG
jgi:2'-hydroxyisoflavone reductase